ncbi:hypothetical protein D3C83_09160 [compost metagenome]
MPSQSFSTSALCCPSSGAGFTTAGLPLKRTGQPAILNASWCGCLIFWMMPRSSKLGSCINSSVSRTAPAGTAAPITRMHSYLSRLLVNSVMIRSSSAEFLTRASRVSRRGSPIRSLRPIASSSRGQCCGLARLV